MSKPSTRRALRGLSACAGLAALALVSACNRPALLLDANADNLRAARTVAAAFYEDYGRAAGLRDVPFVTLGFEGGQGYSYDADHNVLFVTPFTHADFDTQKIFGRSTQAGQSALVYDDLMFRFFTAHQLMHLVYERLPVADGSHYEEELRINTLTTLFLQERGLLGGADAELAKTLTRLEKYLRVRFPSVTDGTATAATLTVDDNSSYWYVTANSLATARRRAAIVGTTNNYLASLSGGEASLSAGH